MLSLNNYMQFEKLAKMIIEAKGEKPGQRYHGARQSSGPSGMSSTPVGRRDFNPEISKPDPNRIVDKKAASVRKAEKILRHCFRVIKASPEFRSKLNDILTKYNKSRKQIREDEEKVLSYNPGHIDNLWGKRNRLQKIIDALGDDKRVTKFVKELEEVDENILKYQEDLDDVRSNVQSIIYSNELMSKEAAENTVKVVQKVAAKEFDDLITKLTDREKAQITLKSLNQIEPEHFDEETLQQDEYRLELLNVLMAENEEENPLMKFFSLTKEQYNDAKGSDAPFAGVVRNTQNVSVEMLFNRLPMSAFSYFYNATHDDLPLSRISPKKRKQIKVYQPVKQILNDIKSPQDWDNKKWQVKDLISELDVDPGRMRALQDIVTGPYKHRGKTVVQRLLGMLGTIVKEATLPELQSDLILLEILSKYAAD